jgi:hypothetical protein
VPSRVAETGRATELVITSVKPWGSRVSPVRAAEDGNWQRALDCSLPEAAVPLARAQTVSLFC